MCEDAQHTYLQAPQPPLESSDFRSKMTEKLGLILGDHYFTYLHLCIELLKSRSLRDQIAAIRFLGSCHVAIDPEVREHADQFCAFLEGDDTLTASLATIPTCMMALRERSFLDELCGNVPLLDKLCSRLRQASDHLHSPDLQDAVHEGAYLPGQWRELDDMNFAPLMGEALDEAGEGLIRPAGTWGVPLWSWVAAQALSLLACLADVLDVLGTLLTHNVLDVAMRLLELAEEGKALPLLVLHAARFLEKAVAHRRLACDFVDKDGLQLLWRMRQSSSAVLTDAQLSACLTTIAAHSQVSRYCL